MLMPGWEWVGAPGGGAYYANDVPDKIVLHSTEGGSAAGAIAAYRSHGSWPHFTVDYWANRRIQHIDTEYAASALYNQRGNSYEPNRSGKVIQVEVVGFAAQVRGYPPSWYQWLAAVLGEIARSHGIPANAMKTYDAGDGFVLASEHSPIRVDEGTFNNWHGWLCHQHLGDGNDHWDAPFRMEELLSLIYGGGRIWDPRTGHWTVVGSEDIEFSPAWTGDDDLTAEEHAQLAAVFNWVQQLCGWQAEIATAATGQIVTTDPAGRPVTGGIKVPTVLGNVMEAATSVRPNSLGTLEQRIAAQVAAVVPKPAASGAQLDDAALQRLAGLISQKVEAAAAEAAADIIRQLLVPKAAS